MNELPTRLNQTSRSRAASIEVPVAGMSCASCVKRVEKAAAAVPGVAESAVNFATETLTIKPQEGFSAEKLLTAIQAAGYEAKPETVELEIEDMTCASCVGRVEKALKAVPAVERAAVNLATGRATVSVLGGKTQAPALLDAVRKAGYGARLVADTDKGDAAEAARAREISTLTRDFAVALVLTLPLFAMEMGTHIYPPLHHTLMEIVPGNLLNYIQFALATAVLLGPGLRFYLKGFPALLRGGPDMNSLVAIGTSAAYGYSLVTTFMPELLPYEARNVYYEAATVIVTLILLGRLLEARAKGRTGEAIRRLAGLQAKTARVERDGVAVDIATEAVLVGDIVVIRPGERIPVDGIVIDGSSYVDESMISGEPVPVEKGPDATVIGGTINTSGSFRFRTEKVGADTMLSQIIRMVGEAQGSKLPIQMLVDRVTGWFVPVVMAIAALTFLVWLFLGPEPAYTYGLVTAVAVLIIACPCAMGLATPTSIMVGTGRAAELGVLFRKGEALQKLREADTVVMDKTGTITKGRPELTDFFVADGFSEDEVLMLAASLESRSEHPLAEAIVKAAEARKLALAAVDKAEAVPGFGITGIVAGRAVAAGADRLMAKLGLSVESFSGAARRLAAEGKTPLYVAIDGVLAGAVAITDPLKETSRAAVSALLSMGLKVVMVTGDNRGTAEAIARATGIDEVIAEVLPEGKVEVIKRLRDEGRVVAFVGDGINDAPALASADTGLAIGTGTDVAIESADVVLVGGDLGSVVHAVELSRMVMRNIRENLFWAFGYNVLLIPVAAGLLYPAYGLLLSPMIGAGAMGLSSVFVVTNALRLKRAQVSRLS